MPILPVVLWTDLLLFALIGVAIAAAFYVRGQPHLLAGWRGVAAGGAAMSALTVLTAFVAVGVLDSISVPRSAEVKAASIATRSK